MTFKNYREESRSQGWGSEQSSNLTIEQLQTGCILRIADATEKMASNYLKMENDLKHLGTRHRENLATIERLQRSNAALRGHIKRLKNKK